MKKVLNSRLLCLLVICALLIGSFPEYIVKADDTFYTKVTSLSEITDGDYILYGVNDTYTGAMGSSVTSGRINAIAVNESNGVITNPDQTAVWTITALESTYTLKNKSTGSYVDIIKSSTSGFGMTDAPAEFEITQDSKGDGAFLIAAENTAANGRAISIYQSDFRPYDPQACKTLYLYKLSASTPVTETDVAVVQASLPDGSSFSSGQTVSLSCATESAVISYQITEEGKEAGAWNTYNSEFTLPDASCTLSVIGSKEGLVDSTASFSYTFLNSTSIADARAMNQGTVSVSGIVTFIDGKSIYIQDASAAIVAYRSSGWDATPLIGQTLDVTGTIGDYKGLKQLAVETYSIGSEIQDLPQAKEVTIEELTDSEKAEAIEAQRILIKDVTIGTINTSGNTSISKDEDTINIYKCPSLDEPIYEGCLVTVTAILSQFNTYQLRVAGAGDVILNSEPSVVAEITADQSSEVVSGTMITFATKTSGAVIFTSTDGSVWTEGNTYTVTGNVGDSIIIYVKAEKAGAESAERTFTFTLVEKGYDPIPDDSELFNDAKNIKEVLETKAGSTGVSVVGQLVFLATSYDNPVIQDVIDGKTYSLYIYGSAPDGAKVGDIVKFTDGTFTIYSGLPELMSTASQEIVGTSDPMAAEEYTIAQVKEDGLDMLSRYIKIKDVTLGEYNASGSTKLVDSTGTINMYKGAAYPDGLAAGDVVDLYAMVACYNSTVQLYTGSVSYVLRNDTKAPIISIAETLPDAKTGLDYTISAKITDVTGIKEARVSITIGTETNVYDLQLNDGDYTYILPGTAITKDISSFTFTITAVDSSDNSNSVTSEIKTVQVENKPQITVVAPAINSSTGDETMPEFKVLVSNALSSPKVELTVSDQTVEMEYSDGFYRYKGIQLSNGSQKATVKVTREDGVSNEITWNFTVGELTVKRYFGQLHSHTQYSDGSGTLAIALQYFEAIAKEDNVDFVSFTDHSNYFDTTANANPAEALNDISKMTSESKEIWNEYTEAVDDFNAASEDKLALSGFEMTWSGGPGHINTFNSVGVISRNNTELNAKTSDAGLQAYYDVLTQNTDKLANLSQFNHPGTTFGNFSDFAYYTPARDTKMVMVEVGNGEGGIGGSGYFPSYEEYTLALDKGWHVAPTNNQDNHKGKWGNSNTARSVLLADSLTEEGLLTAMSERRIYATEDKNLEIDYTINQEMMGTIISDIPTSNLQVQINAYDPDAGDTIAKIELVTNSGKVVQSKACSDTSENWAFELPVEEGYYYVRITEADLNIAVTAPIWIGSAPLVGINSVDASTKMPVTGEELTVTTSLFNNEEDAKQLESITYTVGDNDPLVYEINQEIPSLGSVTHDFAYTPDLEGNVIISIEIIISGMKYTTKKELKVVEADKLIYVGIDASNYNEYVNGNYKDSMGNFAELAADYSVRVVELKTEEELIAATKNPKYEMLILTPPTRRSGSELLADYQNWSEEEIKAITEFAQLGKTVILTGWGDYYESYEQFPQEDHMSAQQNKLLAALGAHLRLSDDEIKDETNNGGQAQRLYLTEYNWDNPLMQSIDPTQVYSCYGGCTVYIVGADGNPIQTITDTVSPLVYAFETSVSFDDDNDSYAGITIPKYQNKYMTAATETVLYENGNTANIIVAGSAFMSNFEIQVDIDNAGTLPYSNYTIAQNILKSISPVTYTKIADVCAASEGQTFTIQGIATSNSSGYDKLTAFFDCIYIQDETGGINLFPVSDTVKAGQTVIVTGVTSSYNGERQLQVETIEVLSDSGSVPEARKVTAQEVNQYQYLGQLVKVEGTVTKVHEVNGIAESIYVTDSSKEETRIFIDGYITPEKEIANLAVGCFITAVGLSSKDTSYEGFAPRIRIRDRADIICTAQGSTETGESTEPMNPVVIDGQTATITVPFGKEEDKELIKEYLMSAILTPEVSFIELKVQGNLNAPPKLIITKEVLKIAAIQNKDILFIMTDSSDKELYSILFTAANLKKAEKLNDFDVRLQIECTTESVAGYDGILVSFAQQGELEFQVTVNIALGSLINLETGSRLYVYGVNRVANKLEPIPFGTTYRVSMNNDITFKVVIGREYILTTKRAKKGTIITTKELIQLLNQVTLNVGETKEIGLILPPTLELLRTFYQEARFNAIGRVIASYVSSDKSIAVVGKDGIIRPKKAGTVIITTTITTYFGAKYSYKTIVTVQ